MTLQLNCDMIDLVKGGNRMAISLKGARVEAGMSLEEVSKSLKIAPSTISNWENGVTDISAVNLYRLADLYKVAINDFLLPKNYS